MTNFLKKIFNKKKSSNHEEHFFPIRAKNGKYGFVDMHWEFRCEPQYENAKNFPKWTEPNYLAPVKIDGKWGYIDKNFDIVIEHQFDDAMIFSEGVATVRKNGLWAYIDKNGELLTDVKYRIALESRDNEIIVCDNEGVTGNLGLSNRIIYPLDEKKSELHKSNSIGVLSTELQKQLDKIEYSFEDYMLHYPCKVSLKNGEIIENVLITDVWRYQRYWHNPFVMNKDIYININDVVKIEESPNRLPAHLANERYLGPESGMGYTRFRVHFDNGSKMQVVSSNVIDFIPYANGMSQKNVIAVDPGDRDCKSERGLDFKWCLWK